MSGKLKKIFFVFLISIVFLPRLASADLIVPQPAYPSLSVIVLFLAIDLVFNFLVAAGFFKLLKKNILEDKPAKYFFAIFLITGIGFLISLGLRQLEGYFVNYAVDFTIRGILSIGQIIAFPFIFSWLGLSDKRTAFKAGLATVILGFILGSIIAIFYIGGLPVTPLGSAGP